MNLEYSGILISDLWISLKTTHISLQFFFLSRECCFEDDYIFFTRNQHKNIKIEDNFLLE